MPRTAKQIMIARGYTEEELAQMPLMADPRFCKVMEDEEVERERLSTDLRTTTEWYHQKAKPALTRMAEDAAAARAETARVQAELQARQDYGLSQVARQQGQNTQGQNNQGQNTQGGTPPQLPSGFDPSKFVDADTFQQTTAQYANAIAMANDITEDHRDLFGTRLPGGITGLRNEYQQALANHTINGNVSLQQFWESKFNVAAKRTEISAAARQKEISDAVAAEKVKWQSEQLNPNSRTLVGSRSPFSGKIAQNGTVEGGKQPWERGTDTQRHAERVLKVVNKQLTAA